jgi:hypothetical protein
MGVGMGCEDLRSAALRVTTGWGAVADGGWDCEGRELTAYQRAAIVALRLRAGERLRTSDVMRMCRMQRSGALKMLGHLAALPEMPLILDEEGFWGINETIS